MDRFSIENTSIEDVKVITPHQFKDNRGFYERFFCIDEFKKLGLDFNIVQINHSSSYQKGTVRGFHYQSTPYQETKIVRCIKGAIFDVALDIRPDSKTYLQYVAFELSERNNKYLVIPKGFAHAFQTLEDNSEILYMVDTPFAPEYELGLNPLDPKINVNWPLDISVISDKDKGRLYIGGTLKC